MTRHDQAIERLKAIAIRMVHADPDGAEIEHINHEALVAVLAFGEALAAPSDQPDALATAKLERAIRVMTTGWCPWPYLGATAPGDTGLDHKAECSCGKRVLVTARGFMSHHKFLRRPSVDDVRRG